MSMLKDIKKIFAPHEAEEIIHIYDSLYYSDIQKEYEDFYHTGSISDEFLSATDNNEVKAYVVQLEFPQNDSLATLLVLKHLQRKSSRRTEEQFYECLKVHDMKTLKRILKYNDPEGIYNKMVTEVYGPADL